MMAKRSATFVLLLFITFACTFSSGAQTNESEGEITGIVVNAENKVILNASIILQRSNGGEEILAGEATDESGAFTISYEPGIYNLQISYVSYDNQNISVEIVSGETLDLGRIQMIPEQAQLDEVVVEGERSYMEMNFDSRSFNVGSDITNLGGNALDVLDNVPSISTDFEGNVSLRGNEGVQILINGRPSNLMRGGTDRLGSIPASMIDEIEVITNPSANKIRCS